MTIRQQAEAVARRAAERIVALANENDPGAMLDARVDTDIEAVAKIIMEEWERDNNKPVVELVWEGWDDSEIRSLLNITSEDWNALPLTAKESLRIYFNC